MSNPILRNNIYANTETFDKPMTIQGTILKTLLLTLIMILSASFSWGQVVAGFSDRAQILFWVGCGVSLFSVILASFNIQHSKPFSIAYAIGEGLALGSLSAIYAKVYEGIVVQAIFATILTMFVMFGLYSSGLIKVTDKLRKIIFTATLSIGIFYLIAMIASIFEIGFLSPFVGAYNNIFVIGFVIIVAAFNLLTDFDMIEKGANNYVPSYFEWYSGMALLVTLVWLYIEFLKLFARSRK